MPASPIPTNLESWLIAIAQHTRETKEALVSQGERQKKQEQEPTWVNGFVRKLETTLTTAAGRGLGQVNSLTNRGFAGTVEQTRYDFAMEQLGRQFAAVMSPVLNGMTYAAQQFEMRMRGWNGSEQNSVMGGILGAGIGYRAAGAPGALAGFALGTAALGEGSSALGAGAGAYAGWRAGAMIGGRLGPVGAVIGAGVGAVALSGDYGRLRGEGNSKFASVFGSGIGALTDLGYNTLGKGGMGIIGGDNPMTAIRREADAAARARDGAPKPPGTDRRDVTPYNPQMVGAGESYFRFQENVIRATAGAGAMENNPFKWAIDEILHKFDQLLWLMNGKTGPEPTVAPPPGSASGS